MRKCTANQDAFAATETTRRRGNSFMGNGSHFDTPFAGDQSETVDAHSLRKAFTPLTATFALLAWNESFPTPSQSDTTRTHA